MDKLRRYREAIKYILTDYASWFPPDEDIQTEIVQTEIVMDAEHDHYELLRVGWKNEQRIHHATLHLDIINGKVWIQYDGGKRPVAAALLAAGVLRADIVLAFHPPEVRQYTDFAAA